MIRKTQGNNTCAEVFFKYKVIKKTPAQVFSCEFRETFHNTFFRTLVNGLLLNLLNIY